MSCARRGSRDGPLPFDADELVGQFIHRVDHLAGERLGHPLDEPQPAARGHGVGPIVVLEDLAEIVVSDGLVEGPLQVLHDEPGQLQAGFPCPSVRPRKPVCRRRRSR